ncbi:MAG: glycosyltransferase family 39 protein, partial [bacterium]|nr:glycosyltransferase family 39 protein [bacterium]
SNLYSMNSIDILLWAIAAYLLVRLIKEDNPKLWIGIGIVIGLGLLNKISMGFFAAGVFAAVLLTKQRKHLTTRWPYFAALIAGSLFLPYIIWNLMHDMAHLEFIHNASNYKYSGVTRIDFVMGQLLLSNPVTLPLWAAGLYFYFFNKKVKEFRLLGITFVTVFLILLINGHSKPEYLSPAYPLIFAAGAVQLERLSLKKYMIWLKYALPVLLVLTGLMYAPLALPFLPVETYISYSKALGMAPQTNESKELSE